MPETTNFNIPFLDGTELVRDYPTFSEDLANAVDGNLLIGTTSDGTNTALGDGALQSNTTGDQNTAVGRQALQSNTTGDENVAVGRQALRDNKEGRRNTVVGNSAGRELNSDNNVIVGYLSGRSMNTGDRNTIMGEFSGEAITTGFTNTFIGIRAGNVTTLGSNNSALGNAAEPSSATASNEVTLGNSNITSLRCNVTSISSLSDVRDKTDIVDTQHGLDTLNKLRPVDFTWARRDGTFGSAPDIGFIAQELASVEDETGDAHRLRLTLRNNPEKLEATPGRLIPILVKAVQELSAKNDELEARIEALEAK